MIFNNLRVAIGIQCRLSSRRLPGKALLKILDTTMLGFCLKRAKLSGFPVYVLTSCEELDDLVVVEAQSHSITGVIRGSLSNVLSRYCELVRSSQADYIVRVTADNPLTEYSFIEPLVEYLISCEGDYAWIDPKLCPEGVNLEVIRASALVDSLQLDSSR